MHHKQMQQVWHVSTKKFNLWWDRRPGHTIQRRDFFTKYRRYSGCATGNQGMGLGTL